MFKKSLGVLVLYMFCLQNIFAFSGELSQSGSLEQTSAQPIPEEVLFEQISPQPHPRALSLEQAQFTLSPQGEGVEQIQEIEGVPDNGTGDIEVQSGSLDNIPQTDIEDQTLDLLYEDRFKLVFQNPSYILDKNVESDKYICDEDKEECKINFNIDDLELSTFSSKFYCKNNFGFITGEEEKCNPKTIIFGTGIYDMSFKIFKKDDDSLIWEKYIEIINDFLTEFSASEDEVEGLGLEQETGTGNVENSIPSIDVGTGVIETNTGAVVFGSGEIDPESSSGGQLTSSGGQLTSSGGQLTSSGGQIEIGSLGEIETNTGFALDIPNPVIEIQSGLNYLTGAIWQCKNEECKINLTAEPSFTGGFIESDYNCLWSFSGGVFKTEGTENKCNPGYINYGTGVFNISLKVFEKENNDNFKLENIVINNEEIASEYIFEELGIESGSGKINSETGTVIIDEFEETPIIIKISFGGGGGSSNKKTFDKDIIIQSGLEYDNGIYICNKDICRVNFMYQKSYLDTCEWGFGDGDYKEKYKHTCNPGIVYFPNGKHKISLKVYKNGEIINSKDLSFENVYMSRKRILNIPPIANIKLQGRGAKYKQIIGNKIVCKGVEECSVNFTGEESYDLNDDKLEYVWDFGNGEIFNGVNPKSIKYKAGKYKLSLEVKDIFGELDIKYFYIEVFASELENLIIDKNIFNNLKISGVLSNNSGVDNYEWIELENTGDKILNLKGLILDDIVGKGSKDYLIKKDIFLGAYQKKRFYKSEIKLSLGNTNDEVNIIYDNKIIDSLKWDFKVPDDFVLTHENIDNPMQEVFVERVVDGDTIVIKFENGKIEKLRLIGVDTPETKHPQKPVEEFGIEAYNFTKQILEGKYVFLELGEQDRGKYGRLLGYIYLDKETSFNELLIEKGYARAYIKYPFKYSKIYVDIEKLSKKNKVGLWGNKEVLKQIKEWIKEDEIYLEGLEKEELYNFDELFSAGFNIDEIEKRGLVYKKILDNKVKDLKKELISKPDFLESWQKESSNKNDSFIVIKDYEKELKKSITYRISKQKKGLKITGVSKEYDEIVLEFAGKKIQLKTDSEGKFTYYTTNIDAGTHSLELYGVDNELGDIYLKSGRDVELSTSYVAKMNSYKYKTNTKNTIVKKTSIKKLEILDLNIEDIKVNKSQFPIILNLILGIITIVGIFIIFRRKKLLQIS